MKPATASLLPTLYAHKLQNGDVNIYLDDERRAFVCKFQAHLTSRPKHNSKSVVVNCARHPLEWIK